MDGITTEAIRLLRQDGRRSFSDIARRIGVNRAQIANRLTPLFNSGSLQVISTLHPRLRGLEVLAHLRIRQQGSPDKLCEILEHLTEVVFASETTGYFQLAVEVHSVSLGKLNETVSLLRSQPDVLEVEAAVYEVVLSSPFVGAEPQQDALNLDKRDRRLIDLLQRDGRLSYTSLATALGFSVVATRERVLRLMQMNVIHIGVVQGRNFNDSNLVCGLGISLNGVSEPVERRLMASAGMEFLARTVGRFDLIGTAAFPSIAELHDFIREIREVEHVLTINTWIHIRTRIERYLSYSSPRALTD